MISDRLQTSNIFSAITFPIPEFAGDDRASPPLAPLGNIVNLVTRDRSETTRTVSAPGAYASATVTVNPPGGDSNVDVDNAPTISRVRCTPAAVKVKKASRCTVNARDDRGNTECIADLR